MVEVYSKTGIFYLSSGGDFASDSVDLVVMLHHIRRNKKTIASKTIKRNFFEDVFLLAFAKERIKNLSRKYISINLAFKFEISELCLKHKCILLVFVFAVIPPDTPKNVSAGDITTESVVLAFDEVSGAGGYEATGKYIFQF